MAWSGVGHAVGPRPCPSPERERGPRRSFPVILHLTASVISPAAPLLFGVCPQTPVEEFAPPETRALVVAALTNVQSL